MEASWAGASLTREVLRKCSLSGSVTPSESSMGLNVRNGRGLPRTVNGVDLITSSIEASDLHLLRALSHYRLALARLCSEHAHQAAAVTTCHVFSASPRNWRSV